MSEARSAALAEAAPAALFEADADMVIQAANPRLEALTGATADDLVGRPFRDLLTRSSQVIYALKAEPTIMSDGAVDEIFLELRHPDGRPRAVLLTVAPGAGEAKGRRYGALLAAPERRAYELELVAARSAAQQAAEARSRFLAAISHELRTPLNGILGVASLCETEAQAPSERERARMIVAAARDLERLVDGVLDFTDLQAGADRVSEAPVDLAVVVGTACEPLKVVAEAHGLDFRIEVDPGLAEGYLADAHRIRQIVRALVGNALKFTPAGEIVVGLKRGRGGEADGVTLFVADTGVGFDMADVGRLFAPFEQGGLSGRSGLSAQGEPGGMGLGLAVVERLVGLMGGAVEAASEPGRGSRFEVRLPLREVRKPPPAQPATPLEDEARPLRVLCAEDNPQNQLIIRMILEHLGLEAEIAGDGEQALRRVAAEPFDLVLMDMQMPVMDGLAATRAIRRLEHEQGRARLPVIMLTANVMSEHVEASLDAGADLHLPKPVTPAALYEAIASVLA